jgi:BRCT domain type II-containing protein
MNFTESGSSKNKKDRDLGVKVIDEEGFLGLVLKYGKGVF